MKLTRDLAFAIDYAQSAVSEEVRILLASDCFEILHFIQTDTR
ncbi:hypothetical protein [Chryseobacterium sp. CP-77]